MSARTCTAGDRCSCGLDPEKRSVCALANASDDKPIKVFGLLAVNPEQGPLVTKHCFGDCGKISIGGAIDDPVTGGLMVCCETVCPWLKKEMTEPYGTTMSFGEPHEIYLRALTDSPKAAATGSAP